MKQFRIIFWLACLMFLLDSCQLTRRVGKLFTSSRPIDSIYSNKEIDNLVETAFHYEGVPYRNGGIDEKGMDCSGLLFRVYADNNLLIPRPTFQQALFGVDVDIADLHVGDWLFFKTNNASSINHVGLVTKITSRDAIYFIHSSTSKGVREDKLQNKYWMKAYVKSLRPYKNNSN